jgi:DNA-binding NarL/FixJ family response regulator
MPNMGGYSVAHRLRNSQPSVKILIYSTHSHSDVERMARTVGCKGCVHKANAARDLVRGVRAILRGGTFYEHDESPAAGGRTRTISCGELPPRG